MGIGSLIRVLGVSDSAAGLQQLTHTKNKSTPQVLLTLYLATKDTDSKKVYFAVPYIGKLKKEMSSVLYIWSGLYMPFLVI